ncbi:MAG: hypothetical protein HYZ14_17585 [Bacteroidetes bacterium]|nr:hypothetical protein [Bacteroidota bacterium]
MRRSFFTFCFLSGMICFSQEVVAVSSNNCDQTSNSDYIRNRLIEQRKVGDTTILKIGIVENCEIIPAFLAKYNLDTLYLSMENVSLTRAACVCCFEFELKIIGIADTTFVLDYAYEIIEATSSGLTQKTKHESLLISENKFIFPSLSEINESRLVNQSDGNGNRVGIWHYYFDGTDRVSKTCYFVLDSNGISEQLWVVLYDSDGRIESVCVSRTKDGMKYTDCISGEEYLTWIQN